jgi:hypothetical protein
MDDGWAEPACSSSNEGVGVGAGFAECRDEFLSSPVVAATSSPPPRFSLVARVRAVSRRDGNGRSVRANNRSHITADNAPR